MGFPSLAIRDSYPFGIGVATGYYRNFDFKFTLKVVTTRSYQHEALSVILWFGLFGPTPAHVRVIISIGSANVYLPFVYVNTSLFSGQFMFRYNIATVRNGFHTIKVCTERGHGAAGTWGVSSFTSTSDSITFRYLAAFFGGFRRNGCYRMLQTIGATTMRCAVLNITSIRGVGASSTRTFSNGTVLSRLMPITRLICSFLTYFMVKGGVVVKRGGVLSFQWFGLWGKNVVVRLFRGALSDGGVFSNEILRVILSRIRLPSNGESGERMIGRPNKMYITTLSRSGGLSFMGRFHCPCGRIILRLPTNGLRGNSAPLRGKGHRLLRRAKLRNCSCVSLNRICPSPKCASRVVRLCTYQMGSRNRRGLSRNRFLGIRGVSLGGTIRVILGGVVPSSGARVTILGATTLLGDNGVWFGREGCVYEVLLFRGAGG